jgi:hypothetical protein
MLPKSSFIFSRDYKGIHKPTGQIFGPEREGATENGRTYTTRSFIIITSHKISLGPHKQRSK